MTKAELYEKLAAIEHQRWADWEIYVLEEVGWLQKEDSLEMLREGDVLLPRSKVDHWKDLISRSYSELEEWSKEADRREVDRYWPLIVEFVAGWLHENSSDREISEEWRDEMSHAL